MAGAHVSSGYRGDGKGAEPVVDTVSELPPIDRAAEALGCGTGEDPFAPLPFEPMHLWAERVGNTLRVFLDSVDRATSGNTVRDVRHMLEKVSHRVSRLEAAPLGRPLFVPVDLPPRAKPTALPRTVVDSTWLREVLDVIAEADREGKLNCWPTTLHTSVAKLAR